MTTRDQRTDPHGTKDHVAQDTVTVCADRRLWSLSAHDVTPNQRRALKGASDTVEPFDTLRDCLPGWTLAITALEGIMGFCDPQHRTIWVDVNLSERERRTTIMHECVHAIRGDNADNPVTEREVEEETARRLIPIRALLNSLEQSTHPDDLCDDLLVDKEVLAARLRSLDESEGPQVRRRLARGLPAEPGSTDTAFTRWARHYGMTADCEPAEVELFPGHLALVKMLPIRPINAAIPG